MDLFQPCKGDGIKPRVSPRTRGKNPWKDARTTHQPAKRVAAIVPQGLSRTLVVRW